MANPINDLLKKQFSERLKFLEEGFASLEKYNVNTVPEDIFKFHFLPFFCGETNENAKELLSTWFTIAGSSYNPVNIVDNNGNIIIQVPPIQDRNVFKPITNRDEDIAYSFTVAKEKATLSPRMANNIITNSLNERYRDIVKDGSDLSIKDKWTALFLHYGKKTISSSTVVIDSNEDEFEY